MAIFSFDLLWVCIACITLNIDLAAGILYQNYDLLPTNAPLTLPLWDPINHQSLTALDQSLLTANDFNKFTAFGPQIYPSTLGTYGTVKAPSDLLDNSLLNYYHNGRYLKQYFVAEDNLDDINELNNFLSRFMPFVPANYNIQPASARPNLGFPTLSQTTPTSPNLPNFNNFYSLQRPQPQPLPLQVGSGSLGFVRLPNGAVYLGSGSLGYIDDKQKLLELNEVRNRQSPQAGPLTFGETPR